MKTCVVPLPNQCYVEPVKINSRQSGRGAGRWRPRRALAHFGRGAFRRGISASSVGLPETTEPGLAAVRADCSVLLTAAQRKRAAVSG